MNNYYFPLYRSTELGIVNVVTLSLDVSPVGQVRHAQVTEGRDVGTVYSAQGEGVRTMQQCAQGGGVGAMHSAQGGCLPFFDRPSPCFRPVSFIYVYPFHFFNFFDNVTRSLDQHFKIL